MFAIRILSPYVFIQSLQICKGILPDDTLIDDALPYVRDLSPVDLVYFAQQLGLLSEYANTYGIW